MPRTGPGKTINASTLLTRRNGPSGHLLSTFNSRRSSFLATSAGASTASGAASGAAEARDPSPAIDDDPVSSDDELASQSQAQAPKYSSNSKHAAAPSGSRQLSPGTEDEPVSSSDDELSRSQNQRQRQQVQKGTGQAARKPAKTRAIRVPKRGKSYKRYGERDDEDDNDDIEDESVSKDGNNTGIRRNPRTPTSSSKAQSRQSGLKRQRPEPDEPEDDLMDEFGWVKSSQSSGRRKRPTYASSVQNIHANSSQNSRGGERYGKGAQTKSREHSTDSSERGADPTKKHKTNQSQTPESKFKWKASYEEQDDDSTPHQPQFRMPVVSHDNLSDEDSTPKKAVFTMPNLPNDTPPRSKNINDTVSLKSTSNPPPAPTEKPSSKPTTVKHLDIDALASKFLTNGTSNKGNMDSLFKSSPSSQLSALCSPPALPPTDKSTQDTPDTSRPFRSSSVLSSLPSSPSAISFADDDFNFNFENHTDNTPRPESKSLDLSNPNHNPTRSPSPPRVRCPFCRAPVDLDFWEEHGGGSAQMTKIKQQMRFCRMHKEESSKLEWAAKGYPSIDWAQLPARLERYHPRIHAILDKSQPSYYRDVLETTMKSGKNRTLAQSIMGDAFHELTPGYYGSKGARIMMEHIMTNFAPEIRRAVSSDRVMAFGGPSGFVQAVLVPEIAVMLIKEDMRVPDDDQADATARQILKESIEIGDLLNEEEEDEVHEILFDHFHGRESRSRSRSRSRSGSGS